MDLWVSAPNVKGIHIGDLYPALREALGKDIDPVTDEMDPIFRLIIQKDAVPSYG